MLLAPSLDGIYFCGETQRREEAVLSAKIRVRRSRMSLHEVQTRAKSKWGLYLELKSEQVGVIWSYKLIASCSSYDRPRRSPALPPEQAQERGRLVQLQPDLERREVGGHL